MRLATTASDSHSSIKTLAPAQVDELQNHGAGLQEQNPNADTKKALAR